MPACHHGSVAAPSAATSSATARATSSGCSGSSSTSIQGRLKRSVSNADRIGVTRVATVVAAFGFLAAPGSAAAPASWAQPQIEAVVASGLVDGTADVFRPDDPLTSGTLARLVAAVRGEASALPVDPAATVSITRLDATLVAALDLDDIARGVDVAVRRAGLKPPARFG